MLLGIVLHGAISFVPGAGSFWGVQDAQSSPLYGILLSSIHGWRMPLFFLVSGFFTAMLWRKRGIHALLLQRFKRIFLPLLLSMLTIMPMMFVVSGYIRSQGAKTRGNAAAQSAEIDVWAAVATGNLAALKNYLDQGGDVLVRDPYGSTPLHVACLFGRAEAAALLLAVDASVEALNNDGKRPEDLLQLDWGTTSFIAQMVQLPLAREAVLAGRKDIAQAIAQRTGRSVTAASNLEDEAAARSSTFALLFQMPVFSHLWFLWFLCWYVCGFALIVIAVQALQAPAVPVNWLTSGLRYLWLIPLAAVAQYCMATTQYAYGPDTSTGLLPRPAVLAYYAVFFGYGAMYFGAGDDEVQVGRGFWWKLAFALLILFPVGLSLQGPDSVGGRILFATMQVSYAWMMSFGMIGLFSRYFGVQRFWVRYLSDSSYWLYLVHLPLLMIFQFLVRDWQMPSFLKFVLICTATTALLLLSYQLFVRNSWIGAFLNGRRYPDRRNAPLDQTGRSVNDREEDHLVASHVGLLPPDSMESHS